MISFVLLFIRLDMLLQYFKSDGHVYKAISLRQQQVAGTGPIASVNWPFLLSSIEYQTLLPATSPMNSNQFEFLRQVPAKTAVYYWNCLI